MKVEYLFPENTKNRIAYLTYVKLTNPT